jgi:hypothetical protein
MVRGVPPSMHGEVCDPVEDQEQKGSDCVLAKMGKEA